MSTTFPFGYRQEDDQPSLFPQPAAEDVEEPSGNLRPLRERQAYAIAAVRQAVAEGHKRIVLQAPTGFGKTLFAAHLISSSMAKGKRPIFVCPAINLVNQTLKAFEDEGIRDIGIIQAQHERTNWCAQLQIASVQTLIRRALPEVDFIIQDECHIVWDKWLKMIDGEAWKDKIVLGLSATPWARGMGTHWTKLVIAATTKQLIAEGWLSPFDGCEPERSPDFSKLKVEKGEFTEASSEAVMGEAKIVADVVQTWIKHRDEGLYEGDRTFLFAVNCNHAKSLRDEFEQAGISCGYMDAFSTDEERQETFRRFRSRDDKIIASVGCLTTGVDEDVRVIIDAAPTRSEILHVQRMGRGLRIAPGKIRLWINDHAGNNRRLGFVTDILHDHLDTRKKGEKGEAYKGDKPAPKPRKCETCFALIPSGERTCPHCGTPVITISDVQSKDGELIRFGSNQKPKPTMVDKQAWYSGFLWIARERGLKEGWAAYRYREKFGVWPNQLRKEPAVPTSAVRSYDTYLRIKYAKGRQKAAKEGRNEL
jgi:superfamily II DNA or RNA helicase